MSSGVIGQWLIAASGLLEVEPPAIEVWHWVVFGVFVVFLLTVDLAVFHRKSHEPTLRESAIWTFVWCAMALGFNAVVWAWRGPQDAVLFLTGYLVEWSLSMDNVFVFAVIFLHFRVPLKYQYRVLFWGILGAIVMRLLFILVGKGLIDLFDWVILIFAAFLIYTGVKLSLQGDSEADPERNLLLRVGSRIFPVAKEDHGSHFFVVENGRRAVTPLFLVLLVVESTDLAFAVDSVPAIIGITKDPFLVFTSNIFAILGLRALYFLLAGVMDMFRYLKYGLSAVLVFVGGKMVAEYVAHHYFGFEENDHVIPPVASLIIILTLLGAAVAVSIAAKRRESRAEQP